MRLLPGVCAVGLALVLAACGASPAPPSTQAPAPSDPLVRAASRVTTATPIQITGYVIDFVKRGSTSATYLEVVALKDGRFLIANEPFHGAIDLWVFQDAPGRALPENATERTARMQTTQSAAKRVGEGGNRAFSGVAPKIRMYLLQDSKGGEFYVSPDASVVETAPPLIPWKPS